MESIFNVLETLFFTNIIGTLTLYEILSGLFKIIFALIALSFLYSIVKMVTLDIRASWYRRPASSASLKLCSAPSEFDFPIRSVYYLSDNTSIGRYDDNTIVLKDPRVSKHQARIVCNENRYFVDDLGSTNVTLLNGAMVLQPAELRSGDVLSFGDLKFTFLNGESDE